MKVLGLILELNPLHNGHEYFIKQSIEKTKPDVVVAVISSSFMMRGDVMVIDKFTRTKMLLELGIDVVLELPCAYCLNNADVFASKSIEILKHFKMTDLCFGVEHNNLNDLLNLSNLLDSPEYNSIIKSYLDKGLSYPTSSYKAICELTNNEQLAYVSTQPNNTLALQYLRNIKGTNITPHLITRINNNYYDTKSNISNIQSATTLRELLIDNKDISNYVPNFQTKANYIDINQAYEKLFTIIKYKFQCEDISTFDKYLNVNEGIENRIVSMLDISNNYKELIENVETKRYPPNRIKRTILSILLNIDKNVVNSSLLYLRYLGCTNNGYKLIKKLDKETKTLLFSSLKNNDNEICRIEIRTSKLYDNITNNNILINEFKVPIKEDNNDN